MKMKHKATDSHRADQLLVLFTGVRVALQSCDALSTCNELMQLIQEFVDLPVRWLALHVPVTKTMELMRIPRPPGDCRLASRHSKALNRAMMLAAARGYLHILEWLDVYHDSSQSLFVPVSRHVMDVAVAFGRADVVQWLHNNRGEGCSQAAMVAACEIGRVDLLQWLYEHTNAGCPPWTKSWVISNMKEPGAPASSKIVAVTKWLQSHDLGGNFSAIDMDTAALEGRLDIVQFLHESSPAGCTADAMDNAAQRGHLDIVRFLHANRSEGCTTDAMDMAAVHGHLDTVIFLHEHRTEGCTTMAMDYAARGGHFHIVKWLHENRFEGCTVTAMNGAIRSNRFEIVKFLHEHRKEGSSPRVLLSAVFAGNLEIVRWLFEHYPSKFTPPIVLEAIQKARQFYHLDIALWLEQEVKLPSP